MRAVAIYAARALALSTALLSAPASAQTGLTERLRVQGAYAHQTGLVPPDDFSGQVVPELSLLVLGKRSQLRATYTLAASLHTVLPADLANRVNVTSAFDLSKRTTFLLSAEAGHTSVTNALLTRSATEAPVGAVPLTSGQLLTLRLGEGTSWEASPVVRVGQVADVAYVTTLDAPTGLESYLASAVVSVDRSWKMDALGVDLRSGYAVSHTEPLPTERLIPIALTPHWRHDISRSLTSFFVTGASIVFSPDPGTRPLVGPYAQASCNYLLDDAVFELTGSVGTQTNAITAQLLYADQVTFRAAAPISVQHKVFASGSLGYTHGTVIDRRRGALQPPDFDTIIADAGLGWSPTEAVELFARYQFLDQITADTVVLSTPAVVRNAVIIGIQLSSRPDPTRVPTRFPQRVDRSDAAPSP